MNARDKLKALPLVASMLGDKLGVRVIIGKNGTACISIRNGFILNTKTNILTWALFLSE